MTLANWPESLPSKVLIERYQETFPDTVVRTSMEQGPAKLRQRSSAGVGEMTVGYLLTVSQVGVLEDFYRTTLAGGSLGFSYQHPRRSDMVTARFRKPPQIAPRSGRYYLARLELEILP